MLRRIAVLALMLALPALAAAQHGPRRPRPWGWGPPPSGPTLSAWLGLGFPSGNISDEGDGALGDAVSSEIPIGLGVGYRFSPIFHGGLFFEGAPLNLHHGICAPGDPCGGSDLRLGVDAQLRLAPYRRADPWVGVGLAYEWLRFDATGCDAAGTCFPERFQYGGWIFPRISAGLDVAVSPAVRIGPYLTFSAGQFTNVDTTSAGSQSIGNQAFHEWFEIGFRGDLDL
jgi:hypothetical protein